MKAPDNALHRGAFTCLVLITFLTAIGNTGLISIMPTIGRTIGISDFLVAAIFSLSALVWAVSSPMWAAVADRRGRKPLIQLGMVGFIGSMIGCSAVIWAGLQHWLAPLATFIAFFLFRATYGVFGSAASTATQAYIADRTESAARVRALSGLAGALSLGTIFGPAIAPFLVIKPFGLIGPMLAFALFAAVALSLSFVMIPRDAAPEIAQNGGVQTRSRVRDLLRDPAIAPFLIYGMILASAQAINIYSLGFVVIDRMHNGLEKGQLWIGMIMCAGAISGLIGQWGMVRWFAMTPSQMVRWGALLALIGNLAMMVDIGIAPLFVGFSIASLGYGFGRPGFSAGASIAGGAGQQAGIAAAVSSIAGASIVVPPVIAVALYRQWPLAPFIISVIALIGVWAYSLWSPALGKRAATVS